jgi:SAM-dependent methyltransferase
MTAAYGKMGLKDREVIDDYLRRLPDPATVVNLGCGPCKEPLYELGRTLALQRRQRCKLILADIHPEVCKLLQSFFVPGRLQTTVKQVNAFYASRSFRTASTDLIIALGLFGDLAGSPRPIVTDTSHGNTRILRECHKILRAGGVLVISNSSLRQPKDEFIPVATAVGFLVDHLHQSPAIYGPECSVDERYLVILRK